MKKIYCVEDDLNILELVQYTLKSTGFETSGFESAALFFEQMRTDTPDLILLDIMLPDMDGMEILKKLKENAATAPIPVILLTAKGSQMDKVKGLDSGADDYITKPFDILELVSRINAVLRRTGDTKAEDCIFYKNLKLDLKSRTVLANGEKVILTYKEFELLHCLLENRGIVLTRDALMNKIWDTEFEGETRTVDVHVRTLRQKLGKCGEYILTVRNVGYKVE